MSITAGQVWLAYNAAENDRDFTMMSALVAADLRVTVNGRLAVSSAQDDERAMSQLIACYPDYRRAVDEVIEFPGRAVVRWRMRGTPADDVGRAMDISGCSIVAVENGVMTEAFLYYDGAALDAVLEQAAASEAAVVTAEQR